MGKSINQFDFIIIGNGIAAKCLLWELASLEREFNILQLFDEESYPNCTLRTTSVVSMGVHESGVSNLGDILVKSHLAFEKFVTEFKPDGVFEAQQFYLYEEGMNENKLTQYKRRYGDNFQEVLGAKGVFKKSYVIHPESFLSFMDQRIASSLLKVTKLNECVKSLSANSVSTEIGDYTCETILLASSYYTRFFYQAESLPMGKPVSGSYYIWENYSDDRFESSTVLSRGHFNIIYRKETQQLLFGGTSKEGVIYEHHHKELEQEYLKLRSYFKDHEFPPIDQAQVFTGIRHKGKKRTPFAGVVEPGIYAMTSLYKNGFSFPFYGAKIILQELGLDDIGQ